MGQHLGERAVAYADDGYFVGRLSAALEILSKLRQGFRDDAGLELNIKKTQVLCKVDVADAKMALLVETNQLGAATARLAACLADRLATCLAVGLAVVGIARHSLALVIVHMVVVMAVVVPIAAMAAIATVLSDHEGASRHSRLHVQHGHRQPSHHTRDGLRHARREE